MIRNPLSRSPLAQVAKSLAPMLVGVALLVVVVFFAANDPGRFVDWPGLGIVLAGTLAATFLSYQL